MENTLDRELKRGTLEMIILRMLSDRPMYGYELITTLEKLAGRHFHLKEGTLYPVLYRLENGGWIEPRWETLERGVPRKYYHITSSGRERLQDLLREWHDFVDSVTHLLAEKGLT